MRLTDSIRTGRITVRLRRSVMTLRAWTNPISNIVWWGALLWSLTAACAYAGSGDCLPSRAGEGNRCNSGACGTQGCPLQCPCCGSDKVCRTYAKVDTVEKDCWEVECKEVCIPAIRFPWESCCCRDSCDGRSSLLSKCGRVRTVRVLKQVTSEEDTCTYEHKVECAQDCCRRGNGCTSDCLPGSR